MPRPTPTAGLPGRTRPFRVQISTSDGNPARAQLARILKSHTFNAARRSQIFLRYIVEHALTHRDEPLKEYNIAFDVFGRSAYDPAINNTVRVEAGRLRSRLRDYYADEGQADPLVIEIPKGSYHARIHPRQLAATTQAPPTRAPFNWGVPLALVVGALIGYRVSRQQPVKYTEPTSSGSRTPDTSHSLPSALPRRSARPRTLLEDALR